MHDHRCPVPGCGVDLPGYMLACGRHWRQLPPELQTAINRAWARRRRHPDDRDAVGEHLSLVLDAMAVWTEVP